MALAALLVVPPLVFWWLVSLSVDTAAFDPRIFLGFVAWLGYGSVAVTSKLVVADQALWRRAVLGRRVVSLDNLSAVEVRRARYRKREGLPGTVVVVRDRFGRSLSVKRWLWSGRMVALLSLLDTLVQAQGIEVDEGTADQLARAAQRHEARPPWAARTRRAGTGLIGVGDLPPPPTTVGRPRARVTKRGAVALAVLLVGSVAFTFGVGAVGTRLVRNAKCAPNRPLWTSDADVAGPPEDPVDVVGAFTSGEGDWDTQGRVRPMPMSHVEGYVSAEQASATYARGVQITWGDPDHPDAEVDIEEFTSHETALAYQRAWGEWHCLRPESVFQLENQPGTVGFRYAPPKNHSAEEKVAWVRGDTRTEVRWFTDKQETDHFGLTHFAQSAYLPMFTDPPPLACRQGASATASTGGAHLPPAATPADAIRAALPTLDPSLPVEDYQNLNGSQYALDPTLRSVYDASAGSSPVLEHATYSHVNTPAAPHAMQVRASLTKSVDGWSLTSADWCPAEAR